jgi:PAS domain S-box-containing protein
MMHSPTAGRPAETAEASPDWRGYLLAFLLTAAAAGLRLGLDRYLAGVQFITFFPAVILTAFLFGAGPALFAVFLGGMASWYFLIPPHDSFAFEDPVQAYSLALYFVVASAIAILIGNARKITTNLLSAQRALRQSEDRYRRVFEQVNDLVFTADLDQVITDCNPACGEALGMAREEIIGSHIAEFVSEAGYEQTRRMLRHKLEHGGTTRHDIEVRTKSGRLLYWEINSGLATDAEGRITGLHAIARDVTERHALEERQRLLVNELNHRVKNTLALVQGIALQSFKDHANIAEARSVFQQRLGALAKAHDLLTRESWEGATLPELVRETTAHYNSADERVRSSGPDLKLNAKAAVSLVMTLHELCTNAAKYGALSIPAGSVDIRWRQKESGRLILEWIERDGPPVVQPTRQGFGLRLIEKAAAADFGGKVRMEFRPEGLRCVIEALPYSVDQGTAP